MGTSFYNKDSIDELFLCVALNITICRIKRNLCCLVIIFFMFLGRVCVVEASDMLSEE